MLAGDVLHGRGQRSDLRAVLCVGGRDVLHGCAPSECECEATDATDQAGTAVAYRVDRTQLTNGVRRFPPLDGTLPNSFMPPSTTQNSVAAPLSRRPAHRRDVEVAADGASVGDARHARVVNTVGWIDAALHCAVLVRRREWHDEGPAPLARRADLRPPRCGPPHRQLTRSKRRRRAELRSGATAAGSGRHCARNDRRPRCGKVGRL